MKDGWEVLFEELRQKGWRVDVVRGSYWLFTPDGNCRYHGVVGDHADLNRLRWRIIEHGR